ncbi:MAG: type VI secretion system tip protein TssI/VgrG [Planctomycetota bacterium]
MSLTNQEFTFHSDASGGEELFILELRGVESMSRPFRFELELVSSNHDVDLESLLYAPARIGIKVTLPLAGGGSGRTTMWIAGRLNRFRHVKSDPEVSHYHAELVPHLLDLAERHRSRIYMEDTAPGIVLKVLDEAGLHDGTEVIQAESLKNALAQGEATERPRYPRREYVVQYAESDLDFMHRWLEHEGIFYWFENKGEAEETLQLGDSVGSYRALRGASVFPFRSSQATPGQDYRMYVTELASTVNRLPQQVVLQDYNWRQPRTDLRVEQQVRGESSGLLYEYNDHYKSLDQGRELAKVRAEELGCRSLVFQGVSDARNMRPGFTFTLTDHPRAAYNRDLLLTEVVHTARQEIALDKRVVTGVHYENRFTAIPVEECYRPECVTPWPSIQGVMHARIDGESDGEYADLDKFGRYTVRVPFDMAGDGKEDGKASRQIRMLQPYAGSESGMVFPLRKGTEVLLVHLDGDPDRPLIAGAVYNQENPSLVDAGNYTQNRIVTSSGNELTFEDEEGKEGVTLVGGQGATYACYTKQGSMGEGGGGSGGGGGGALRRRERPRRPAKAPRASADALPGGGSGAYSESELGDLNSQSETGATQFMSLTAYSDLTGEPTTDEVNAAYAEVYNGGSITKLNDVCSAFEAAIGKYELIVGGPHVEAKFGSVGEYVEGANVKSTIKCDNWHEKTDSREEGAGSYIEDVGWSKRFNTVKSRVRASHYVLDQIGPDYGEDPTKFPNVVRSSTRGLFVLDELWAVTAVIHAQVAPFVLDVNGALIHFDIHIGAMVMELFAPAFSFTAGLKESDAWFWRDKIRLTELEASLQTSIAKISTNEATVNENAAWIADNKAKVTGSEAWINDNKAKISEMGATIQKQTAAINDNAQYLNAVHVALSKTNTSLTRHDAHLLKKTQAGVTMIGLP